MKASAQTHELAFLQIIERRRHSEVWRDFKRFGGKHMLNGNVAQEMVKLVVCGGDRLACLQAQL